MISMQSYDLSFHFKRDILYGNIKYIKLLLNEIASRAYTSISFRGPNAFNIHTYGPTSSHKSDTPIFFLASKEILTKLRSLNELAKDLDSRADMIIEFSNKQDKIFRSFDICMHLHIEMVTVLIATGLQVYINNKQHIFSVDTFSHYVENRFDKVLVEALCAINIHKEDIDNYFLSRRLPYPSSLYPDNKYNSYWFVITNNLDTWNVKSFTELFDLFFASHDQNMPVSIQHNSTDSPGNVSLHANEDVQAVRAETDTVLKLIGHQNSFYKSGENWVISFNGKQNIMNDHFGFEYIHKIITSGFKGISPVELESTRSRRRTLSEDKTCSKIFDGTNEAHRLEEEYDTENMPSIGNIYGIDTNKHELINFLNDKKMQLAERKIDGLSRHEDLEEMDESISFLEKQIKELKSIIQPHTDSRLKKINDAVSKNINRALSRLEQVDRDLYKHLLHVSKMHKGKFCYIAVSGIEWKLFS